MNHALNYLWLVLLKRRTLHFCRGLRRPGTLMGILALLSVASTWFHFRDREIFAQLVRKEVLIGCAMIMLGGSLFKGFLQRGLVFEPPDIEFLFTGPFTQRQIVFYRLLPNYLFAVGQGLVFLALFAPHLKHPLLTASCMVFFQAACFHVAAGAAIWAGTIPEPLHHRIRWMMLGIYFLLTALYLRRAWDLRIIPSFMTSPLAQVFYFPAVTLTDVGTPSLLRNWALGLMRNGSFSTHTLLQPALYLIAYAAAAAASLWLLLKLKANIFETSLATTTRVADKRLRLEQGRSAAMAEDSPLHSARIPRLRLFHGVGAIIWKNLVVAARSRRELVLALVCTLIYTGLLIALRWVLHQNMAQGGTLPAQEVRDFDKVLCGLLCIPVFLLQRAFPFDFRRDGQHLVTFRTLPISAPALALAEIAVPTALCLAFQALGICVLMLFARFELPLLLVMLLGFPAVALALNGVWNLHYLLAATKRVGGQGHSASPVGLLIVVVLSFLVFYPAGWAALAVGQHTRGPSSELLGIGVWLAVQYAVDFLLVLMLAKLFQRFEVSDGRS